VLNLQPGTDGFKLLSDVSPTAIGNQGLRRAIAGTGRVEHHEGGPTRFRGGQSAGQDGAGVAIKYEHAPPFHAIEGEIHHAPIYEPGLMGLRRFIRMWSRWLLALEAGQMGDIVIHLLVEGHHPSHRPLGNGRVRQQAPNPEASGIGMTLLEMINRNHQWKPSLAGGGLRAGTFIAKPGHVFGLKALYPPIDGGAGDVQDPTDAQLIPSLIVELDDLETCLWPRGLVMIVAKRELALHGDGTVLPESFERLGVKAVLQLAQENPGQFT